NYFLQNRLNKLEKRMMDLQYDYEANSVEGESILTKSFFHANNVSFNANKPVNLDSLHGIVSPLVVTSHDKIAYRNDLGEYLVPSNLEVDMLESTDMEPIDDDTNERKYYKIDTADIKYAFDGDKNSFWIREAEFSENK